MKNTIYIIIVLILIVGGVYLLNSKSVEAPEVENSVENTSEDAGSSIEEDTLEGEVKTEVKVGTEVVVEGATVKEFTVEGKNFAFIPNTIKVKKGDKVKITFKNTEGFHDWKIDAYGVATKQIKAPSTEVLEFTADKAGSFEYYCSVGQHRAQGMKGTLVVE